MKFEALI